MSNVTIEALLAHTWLCTPPISKGALACLIAIKHVDGILRNVYYFAQKEVVVAWGRMLHTAGQKHRADSITLTADVGANKEHILLVVGKVGT